MQLLSEKYYNVCWGDKSDESNTSPAVPEFRTCVNLWVPVCFRTSGGDSPSQLARLQISVDEGIAIHLNDTQQTSCVSTNAQFSADMKQSSFSQKKDRYSLMANLKDLTFPMNLSTIFTKNFLIFSCISLSIGLDGFHISLSVFFDISILYSSWVIQDSYLAADFIFSLYNFFP